MGYTPQQQAAIDAQGKVIVSASAGSGKTTVMIERIVRLMVEEKVPISKFLIVTFTKASSSDMKNKLIKKLIRFVVSRGRGRERRNWSKVVKGANLVIR